MHSVFMEIPTLTQGGEHPFLHAEEPREEKSSSSALANVGLGDAGDAKSRSHHSLLLPAVWWHLAMPGPFCLPLWHRCPAQTDAGSLLGEHQAVAHPCAILVGLCCSPPRFFGIWWTKCDTEMMFSSSRSGRNVMAWTHGSCSFSPSENCGLPSAFPRLSLTWVAQGQSLWWGQLKTH